MRRLIAAACAALAAAPVSAHDGHTHGIGWSLGPEVVLPLLLTLVLYLTGLTKMWRRSGRGRNRLAPDAQRFVAGWLILAGSLVSPLHEAGEVSFTMHMVEHELIMLPAALLLVSARPGPIMLWSLPAPLRRLVAPLVRLSLWRWLALPLVATILQALVMIVWHIPALFDQTLRSDAWHVAQHLSFILSALLFWWAMLPRGRDVAGNLVSALCLFVTSMIGGGIGALMALDASPWYAGYASLGMTPFGLSPTEDQQLAGTIMWVPGGLFHLIAALVFLARSLRSARERLDPGISGGRKAA